MTSRFSRELFNISTLRDRAAVTTYPRHGKSYDKLFPHSPEQEMKPKQIDSSYRGGHETQTILKIFLQPTRLSCLCQQEEPQRTNFTPAAVTNGDVFVTGSCKGTGSGGSISPSYLNQSGKNTPIYAGKWISSQFPGALFTCRHWFEACVCDLTVYTVILLLRSKTKTAGSGCWASGTACTKEFRHSHFLKWVWNSQQGILLHFGCYRVKLKLKCSDIKFSISFSTEGEKWKPQWKGNHSLLPLKADQNTFCLWKGISVTLLSCKCSKTPTLQYRDAWQFHWWFLKATIKWSVVNSDLLITLVSIKRNYPGRTSYLCSHHTCALSCTSSSNSRNIAVNTHFIHKWLLSMITDNWHKFVVCFFFF